MNLAGAMPNTLPGPAFADAFTLPGEQAELFQTSSLQQESPLSRNQKITINELANKINSHVNSSRNANPNEQDTVLIIEDLSSAELFELKKQLSNFKVTDKFDSNGRTILRFQAQEVAEKVDNHGWFRKIGEVSMQFARNAAKAVKENWAKSETYTNRAGEKVEVTNGIQKGILRLARAEKYLLKQGFSAIPLVTRAPARAISAMSRHGTYDGQGDINVGPIQAAKNLAKWATGKGYTWADQYKEEVIIEDGREIKLLKRLDLNDKALYQEFENALISNNPQEIASFKNKLNEIIETRKKLTKNAGANVSDAAKMLAMQKVLQKHSDGSLDAKKLSDLRMQLANVDTQDLLPPIIGQEENIKPVNLQDKQAILNSILKDEMPGPLYYATNAVGQLMNRPKLMLSVAYDGVSAITMGLSGLGYSGLMMSMKSAGLTDPTLTQAAYQKLAQSNVMRVSDLISYASWPVYNTINQYLEGKLWDKQASTRENLGNLATAMAVTFPLALLNRIGIQYINQQVALDALQRGATPNTFAAKILGAPVSFLNKLGFGKLSKDQAEKMIVEQLSWMSGWIENYGANFAAQSVNTQITTWGGMSLLYAGHTINLLQAKITGDEQVAFESRKRLHQRLAAVSIMSSWGSFVSRNVANDFLKDVGTKLNFLLDDKEFQGRAALASSRDTEPIGKSQKDRSLTIKSNEEPIEKSGERKDSDDLIRNRSHVNRKEREAIKLEPTRSEAVARREDSLGVPMARTLRQAEINTMSLIDDFNNFKIDKSLSNILTDPQNIAGAPQYSDNYNATSFKYSGMNWALHPDPNSTNTTDCTAFAAQMALGIDAKTANNFTAQGATENFDFWNRRNFTVDFNNLNAEGKIALSFTENSSKFSFQVAMGNENNTVGHRMFVIYNPNEGYTLMQNTGELKDPILGENQSGVFAMKFNNIEDLNKYLNDLNSANNFTKRKVAVIISNDELSLKTNAVVTTAQSNTVLPRVSGPAQLPATVPATGQANNFVQIPGRGTYANATVNADINQANWQHMKYNNGADLIVQKLYDTNGNEIGIALVNGKGANGVNDETNIQHFYWNADESNNKTDGNYEFDAGHGITLKVTRSDSSITDIKAQVDGNDIGALVKTGTVTQPAAATQPNQPAANVVPANYLRLAQTAEEQTRAGGTNTYANIASTGVIQEGEYKNWIYQELVNEKGETKGVTLIDPTDPKNIIRHYNNSSDSLEVARTQSGLVITEKSTNTIWANSNKQNYVELPDRVTLSGEKVFVGAHQTRMVNDGSVKNYDIVQPLYIQQSPGNYKLVGVAVANTYGGNADGKIEYYYFNSGSNTVDINGFDASGKRVTLRWNVELDSSNTFKITNAQGKEVLANPNSLQGNYGNDQTPPASAVISPEAPPAAEVNTTGTGTTLPPPTVVTPRPLDASVNPYVDNTAQVNVADVQGSEKILTVGTDTTARVQLPTIPQNINVSGYNVSLQGNPLQEFSGKEVYIQTAYDASNNPIGIVISEVNNISNSKFISVAELNNFEVAAAGRSMKLFSATPTVSTNGSKSMLNLSVNSQAASYIDIDRNIYTVGQRAQTSYVNVAEGASGFAGTHTELSGNSLKFIPLDGSTTDINITRVEGQSNIYTFNEGSNTWYVYKSGETITGGVIKKADGTIVQAFTGNDGENNTSLIAYINSQNSAAQVAVAASATPEASNPGNTQQPTQLPSNTGTPLPNTNSGVTQQPTSTETPQPISPASSATANASASAGTGAGQNRFLNAAENKTVNINGQELVIRDADAGGHTLTFTTNPTQQSDNTVRLLTYRASNGEAQMVIVDDSNAKYFIDTATGQSIPINPTGDGQNSWQIKGSESNQILTINNKTFIADVNTQNPGGIKEITFDSGSNGGNRYVMIGNDPENAEILKLSSTSSNDQYFYHPATSQDYKTVVGRSDLSSIITGGVRDIPVNVKIPVFDTKNNEYAGFIVKTDRQAIQLGQRDATLGVDWLNDNELFLYNSQDNSWSKVPEKDYKLEIAGGFALLTGAALTAGVVALVRRRRRNRPITPPPSPVNPNPFPPHSGAPIPVTTPTSTTPPVDLKTLFPPIAPPDDSTEYLELFRDADDYSTDEGKLIIRKNTADSLSTRREKAKERIAKVFGAETIDGIDRRIVRATDGKEYRIRIDNVGQLYLVQQEWNDVYSLAPESPPTIIEDLMDKIEDGTLTLNNNRRIVSGASPAGITPPTSKPPSAPPLEEASSPTAVPQLGNVEKSTEEQLEVALDQLRTQVRNITTDSHNLSLVNDVIGKLNQFEPPDNEELQKVQLEIVDNLRRLLSGTGNYQVTYYNGQPGPYDKFAIIDRTIIMANALNSSIQGLATMSFDICGSLSSYLDTVLMKDEAGTTQLDTVKARLNSVLSIMSTNIDNLTNRSADETYLEMFETALKLYGVMSRTMVDQKPDYRINFGVFNENIEKLEEQLKKLMPAEDE